MRGSKFILGVGLGSLTLTTMVAFANAPIIQGHVTQPITSGSNVQTSSSASMPLEASATTQTPDQALVTSADTSSAPNTLTISNQLTMLQQQLQQLRGEQEVQAHTIAQIQSQISQLSGGKFPAPGQATSRTTATTQPVVASSAAATATATPTTQTPTASSTPSTSMTSIQSSVEGIPQQPTPQAEEEVANNAPTSTLTETQLYQQAYNLMVAKQYPQATTQLQAYLQQYPNGQYAASAHYALGELALIKGDMPQAQSQFNIVVSQFAQAPEAADSMLKLGMIYSEQSQWKQAKAEFNQILQQYPNTPTARAAQQQLQLIQQSGN